MPHAPRQPAASHSGTPCAPEHSLVCGPACKEVRRISAASAAARAERFLQRARGHLHHSAPRARDGGRRRATRRARCWRCRRGRARPARTRPPRCRRPPPPATPQPTRSSPTCGCASQRTARRPPRCGRPSRIALRMPLRVVLATLQRPQGLHGAGMRPCHGAAAGPPRLACWYRP
jgi:hypothetical protein